MRPWVIGVAIAAVLLLGVGALYLRSEGALFSRGHHEWRVVVEPDGNGSWALFVPRLMSQEPERLPALDAMLSTLEVTEGRAGFALDHMRMRVDGEGRAELVARRELAGAASAREREAFNSWIVPDLNATHEEGPPLTVRWSVDFSGGGGHTCWASTALSVTLAPAESRSLQADPSEGPTGSALRPWQVLCA